MKKRIPDKERLFHILDAINSIEKFTKDVSHEEFIADFKLRLALIRLLEIVGEATGSISAETMLRFPDVEWAIIKSFRNVLAHEYFGIDYQIVWKTIQYRIPELKEKMQYILQEI